MRFLHTADWHLGRTLHGVDLIEDQAHFIDRCYLPALRDHRPDAVVLAGDVFDRALPASNAVELFDRAVASTVLDLGIPMLVVAGNHDGPERLASHRTLLGSSGFHVVGRLRGEPDEIVIDRDGDRASFWLVPFPDCLQHQARRRRELEAADPSASPRRVAIPSHRECMEEAIRQIEARMQSDRPNILVTHAMVAGSSGSSSERPVCVGNAEAVPHDLFDRFDYVALGHIHRPQRSGRPEVRYCGSPLAYAFDEVAQSAAHGGKQMLLVEVSHGVAPRVETIQVIPKRPLAIVRGTADELAAGPPPGLDPEAYVLAQRTDAGSRAGLFDELRHIYPNLLRIEFTERTTPDSPAGTRRSHLGRSPEEVVREFLQKETPASLTEADRQQLEHALSKVLAELQSADREGAAA